MTYGWRRLLRLRFGRTERDVDDEVRFHIAERVADLEALGETPESARERALEEFGDVDAVRAELVSIDRGIARHQQRAGWWEGMAQDARHVARGLVRTPGLTVMVVVTMALGIGANAVVFSLIDRLFFQPPAGVPHPEMVRRVMQHLAPLRSTGPRVRGVYNYPEVRSVAEAAPAGVMVAAYVDDGLSLGGAPGGPKVAVAHVVGDYFGVLGIRPEAGRFFDRDEQRPIGLTPVAVISHRFWELRFQGRHDVLGEEIELGPHRYTIVGIAPERFEGISLDATEVWLPYNTMGEWTRRKADWYEAPYTLYLRMIARVPIPSLANALVVGSANALRASEITRGDSSAIVSLSSIKGAPEEAFHSGEFSISRRLAGVAMIIFFIACANVANLLLLRALGRKREIAVRLALGVSRRRLAAQFMSEGLLVAALGGGVALAITLWGSAALRGSILPTVQWGSDGITVRVIAFVMGTTLLAGVLAGVVPAIQSGSPELTTALRGGAREGRTTRGRMRDTLLIVQAALSVVLLAGAALFVMSLRHVEAIDTGYDSDRLIFATAERAPEDTISDGRITAMLPAIAERVRHIPDVEQVALTRDLPMYSFSFEKIFLPGVDSLPATGAFGFPIISAVSPEYFSTTGIAIRKGRGFTAADRAGTELVVVINETMARTYWPKGNALGSCVMLVERTGSCRRVVGIATDAHIGHVIEESSPQYYVPLAQAPEDRGEANAIMIRARSARTASAATAVMREMRSDLGGSATPDVRLMDTWLAREFHQWRLGASLFSVAGLLALLVAAAGIYSTVAYMVGQRTHEIGVRIALGARSGNIARVVIGRGVGIVVAGVAIGVIAALAMGKLVASLLYGVTPHDPVVLGAVAVILLLVAVAACLVPAWRAVRVDPMETLRTE